VRARARAAALFVACALAGCNGGAKGAPSASGRLAPGAASAAPAADPAAEPRTGGAFKRAVSPGDERNFSYPTSPVGPMYVVTAVPFTQGGAKYPVLIALHGRGESFKGPERGARGFIDDYGLLRASGRLRSPPLDARDFHGFVELARLRRINESLSTTPYEGLIVACPYTPDLLAGDRSLDAARPFTSFLVDELLPRIRRELPVNAAATATGIDGVSLGGRVALLVAFERPEAFGAVGAEQAAISLGEVEPIVTRARRAVEKNPHLYIRLLTSHDDYFVAENRALSAALRSAGVRHELVVVPGPHDYEFNRGPGVHEMLLLHDRVLRGRAAL
jgi:enterochelin esterase-like enzyme